MRRNFAQLVSVGAVTLVLALALGCPDTKRLETGNSELTLRVEFVNNGDIDDLFPPDTGGASLSITEILLEPLDEEAIAALGGVSISAISPSEGTSLAQIQLARTDPIVSRLFLPSGSYAISQLGLGGILLISEDVFSAVGYCADPATGGMTSTDKPCDCLLTDCPTSTDCSGVNPVSRCNPIVCGDELFWDDSVEVEDFGQIDVSGADQTITLTIDALEFAYTFIQAHQPQGCARVDEATFVSRLPNFVTITVD